MRKRVSQPDVSQPVPGRPRPLGYARTGAGRHARQQQHAHLRRRAAAPATGARAVVRRQPGPELDRLRQAMVQRLRAQGISDERVLNAMAAVPRHLFVDEALASRAYEESALPIGHSQTISQPWVVARMISAVCEDRAPTRVLEVGPVAAIRPRCWPRSCARFTASNASAVCTNWRAITCARCA